MSTQFMKGCIGYRVYWLPRTSELQVRNCVSPPSRVVLAEMVSSRMRGQEPQGREPFDSSFKRTALEIVKKPPNKEWLLCMLATMDPGCEIFKKDYVKPKVNRAGVNDPTLVDNDEDWFSGLPILHRSNKRSQNVRFTNPATEEEAKLGRMQHQVSMLNDRISSQQARVADMAVDSVV